MEPTDDRAFRRVLGSFATGVSVVAATDGAGSVGLVVSSLTSVSLDPPLVLVCAGRASYSWGRVLEVGAFAVSILSSRQEETMRRFTRRDVDRFDGVDARPGPAGHPVVTGALAWLDCAVEARHDGGDHEIVVARVTALGIDGGEADDRVDGPLVAFRGRYAALDGLAAPLPPSSP